MTYYNGHFCNPMESLSKTNIWACIGNYNILTEIINVLEFCYVGWLLQSLPLNTSKKFDPFACYFEIGACFKVDLCL